MKYIADHDYKILLGLTYCPRNSMELGTCLSEPHILEVYLKYYMFAYNCLIRENFVKISNEYYDKLNNSIMLSITSKGLWYCFRRNHR